ncbi:MAG: phage protease [Tepidibacter sp.]|jgi:phage I-like protein|uniref:phage protease n=1 Tax=Tepidibacter sp. TaxID=2529387 RepID=UPI0025D305A5|nr:phage protease [Tepidibacter sp.]MCT4509910.1 phage protease [Tepidibacter sp.]
MNNYILISNSVSIDGVPDKIKILPLGLVKSQKGDFVVDVESYDLIENAFKDRKLDIVVDYEHQTLENVEAPAAGWVKELDVSTDGIYGKVEWSEKAAMYLKNKEYRYLSPVIYVRKSDKKAAQLHSVALTNTPAIDGMTPIINSSDAQLDEPKSTKSNEVDQFIKELKKMLSLSNESTVEDIRKTIMQLVNQKQNLEMEVNSIKIESHKKEVDSLVLMGIKAGKITPGQKPWAKKMALKDIDDFREYLGNAPQIVPLGEIKYASDDVVALKYLFEESNASKLLGVSDEDLKQYNR